MPPQATRTLPGLSPRVRGNLVGAIQGSALPGSIPACAGEPWMWRERRGAMRVYPRVCGGTSNALPIRLLAAGLSPRVRGNLGHAGDKLFRLGSIPACAGEPKMSRLAACSHRVYPRVCGGTMIWAAKIAVGRGLSPRVRGNRTSAAVETDKRGSIPACAGEPCRVARSSRQPGVYPRVCGGTAGKGLRDGKFRGLSPRVRGNPGSRPACPLSIGSIPACAGEPATPAARTTP